MPKKKSNFNKNEKAILKVLYESRRSMPIRQLAEKVNISWVTVRKYLKRLRDRGFVKEENG